MNERKRIFDLVKQGVISTEEALVLLENIAKETGGRTKPSEDDISQKDWFTTSNRSLDDESSMDAVDELTQLENLEHQIDEINIQLIELNETLQPGIRRRNCGVCLPGPGGYLRIYRRRTAITDL